VYFVQAPILVAVEAVPEASIVIAAARGLAATWQTSVLVLSVREREYTRGLVWDRRPMNEIAEVINGAIFEFERAHVHATGLIRTARSGAAAEQIVETSRQHGARAIIIGSSGRSRLGSLIVSSVSSRVVRMSDVPVILVPTRHRSVAQRLRSPAASAAVPNR
jgi:nucleotide-binding universal stress UspA family protein